MSNDKMREEFEAWYGDRHDGFMPGSYDGEYDWYDCQACWEAWQASRAVLVVELPFEFVNGMMRADQVIAAIEAAGVRVKP